MRLRLCGALIAISLFTLVSASPEVNTRIPATFQSRAEFDDWHRRMIKARSLMQRSMTHVKRATDFFNIVTGTSNACPIVSGTSLTHMVISNAVGPNAQQYLGCTYASGTVCKYNKDGSNTGFGNPAGCSATSYKRLDGTYCFTSCPSILPANNYTLVPDSAVQPARTRYADHADAGSTFVNYEAFQSPPYKLSCLYRSPSSTARQTCVYGSRDGVYASGPASCYKSTLPRSAAANCYDTKLGP